MFRKRLPEPPVPHELASSLGRRLGAEIVAWGPAFSYWHGVVLPYHASYQKTSREAHERFCNGVLVVTKDRRVAFIAESEADVTVLDIAIDWIEQLTVDGGPLPPDLHPAIPPPLGRPTLTLWIRPAAQRTSQPFPGGPTLSQFGLDTEACLAFAIVEASSRPVVEAITSRQQQPVQPEEAMDDLLDEMCLNCMSYVPLGDRFCAKCGTPAQNQALVDAATVEHQPSQDPSDVLVAHVPEEDAVRQVTLECLLDYQGGGIAGSSARSSLLQAVPSPDEQQMISEVAFTCVEAFEQGASSAEQITELLSSTAEQVFAPYVSSASLAFRGLVAATSAAFAATVNQRGLDEAVMVMLMGCTLLQKSHGWTSLREQGR